MIWVNAGGQRFEVAAFVFDKDGLLFASKGFWIALAEERLTQIRKLGSQSLTMEWAKCFGVDTPDGVSVVDVDASGILAIASPAEEVTATAALIVQATGMRWTEARDRANDIFRQADILKPQALYDFSGNFIKAFHCRFLLIHSIVPDCFTDFLPAFTPIRKHRTNQLCINFPQFCNGRLEFVCQHILLECLG